MKKKKAKWPTSKTILGCGDKKSFVGDEGGWIDKALLERKSGGKRELAKRENNTGGCSFM